MSQENPTQAPSKPSDETPATIVESLPGEADQQAPAPEPTQARPQPDDSEAPPRFADDKRASIFKNYQEYDKRRSIGEFNPQGDRPWPPQAEQPVAEQEQGEAPAQPQQAPTAQDELGEDALDKYVTVQVYGQPVRMTVREAMADARLHRAGGVKLDEVKQLHGQLRQLQEDMHSLRSSQGTPTEDSEAERARETQRERLKDIARKLQMGDEDEAAEAISAVIDARVGPSNQPQLNPHQVVAIVKDTLQQEATVSEVRQFGNEAGLDFDNPDPILFGAMQQVGLEEMRREYLNLGFDPDKVMSATRDELRTGLKYLRDKGARVRSEPEMFKTIHNQAVTRLRSWSGTPANPQTPKPSNGQGATPASPSRVELKRTTLPQQPVQRRSPPEAPKEPVSREAFRQQGVQEIRKARGLPV